MMNGLLGGFNHSPATRARRGLKTPPCEYDGPLFDREFTDARTVLFLPRLLPDAARTGGVGSARFFNDFLSSSGDRLCRDHSCGEKTRALLALCRSRHGGIGDWRRGHLLDWPSSWEARPREADQAVTS